MQTTSPRVDRDTIESTVTVQRPVEDVFRFYRDLRNLPEVLGDVMSVEQIDSATYRWTIQGPLGTQVHWTITVTEERPNELIRYQAGWHTSWELHFSPGPEAGSTVVHEIVRSALGPLGRAALALVGKSPQQEVTANLHRLEQLLETGRVTDTRYAVRGKFRSN
jgi:uncharacterized membrane protein